MTFSLVRGFWSMVGVSALALAGCAVNPNDADRFREVLPLQEDVALKVPGGASATESATRTRSGAGLHIATGTGTGSAQYYQFTRDITGAVDFTTAIILGGIWAIVHSEPTSIEAKKAVWGPGSGNALEPAIWRFTVTEVGDAEYDYVLEGQPKAGGDWLPVLNGHGYGKTRAEHRQGWFQANNDNYKKLEPTRGKDEGTTKITFDLKQLPATIAVELRPAPTNGSLDVTVTHDNGGAGQVEIKGSTDVSTPKNGTLEDVHLVSKWNATGAGRGDIILSKGDLPFTVNASECWSSSFERTYYADSVNFQPKSGEESTCASPASKL